MSLEKKLSRAVASANIDRIEFMFEEIYNEYGKLVAFVISKYVPKKEDIEELTNDVFANFSKALGRTQIENIKYYLVTQAKNSAINFLKRNKAQDLIDYVEEFYGGYDDEDKTPYNELVADLRKCLSADEVNIILLHSVYEKSFAAIGREQQKPAATVKSTYHRAIAKYKKKRGIE